jgi:hypothetical protein
MKIFTDDDCLVIAENEEDLPELLLEIFGIVEFNYLTLDEWVPWPEEDEIIIDFIEDENPPQMTGVHVLEQVDDQHWRVTAVPQVWIATYGRGILAG